MVASQQKRSKKLQSLQHLVNMIGITQTERAIVKREQKTGGVVIEAFPMGRDTITDKLLEL